MRLVIEHGERKRLIKGPFNICGSASDLRWLAKCIRESDMNTYGWVQVPEMITQEGLANTSPIPWEPEHLKERVV